MNSIKLAFNMTWLIEISKIYLEGQLLIKYYVIKKLNIAKTPKYVGYQKGFASNIFQYFDKETSGGAIKDEIMSNQELG